MKGLIIKDPWITYILNGDKTWEIRGSNTKMRGTGLIYGTAVLTNSFQITSDALSQGYKNHRIPETTDVSYAKPYVWELSSPIRFDAPKPYRHPQGAVIWVNLSDIEGENEQ